MRLSFLIVLLAAILGAALPARAQDETAPAADPPAAAATENTPETTPDAAVTGNTENGPGDTLAVPDYIIPAHRPIPADAESPPHKDKRRWARPDRPTAPVPTAAGTAAQP
jgi:hypothetical protein